MNNPPTYHHRTVWLEPVSGYDTVYKMVWTASPSREDTSAVFEVIVDVLDSAPAPVYIIVELLSNPHFPLKQTLSGAMQAHSHHKMGKWLVIGSNRIAKLIGNVLTTFNNTDIEWFKTEQQVIQYLETLFAKDRIHRK